jgi:hypothetical protein
MKLRYPTLLVFFILLGTFSLHAQRFLGGVSAGMNLSQVDGDEKYGFHKVGLNIGPMVMLPFGKTKKWSVTMELLFSQVGSYARSQYSSADTVIDSTQYYDGYKLVLDYVQIPIIVHFTDKKTVAAGIGFLYGQLVGVKEWEDHNDIYGMSRTETNLKGPYTQSDLQVLADVRIRLWQHLWLNGRYSYSVLPIRTRLFTNPFDQTDTWTRKQYNNVITLRLTYIFNDELPNKKKAKKK